MSNLTSSSIVQISLIDNLKTTYFGSQVSGENIQLLLNSSSLTDKQNLAFWMFKNKF
jgi:hypothetical protein